MTEENPDTDAPASTANEQEPQPLENLPEQLLRAKANRYTRLATEQSESIDTGPSRIVELLRKERPSEAVEEGLERRAAASTVLARLAHNDVDSVQEYVGSLISELQTERTREVPSEMTQARAVSREIEDALVQTIAFIIADEPKTVAEIDDPTEYIRAITTDLDTETLRAATKALFASASELQKSVLAIETLDRLIGYPDPAVQAWSAGALGRLARECPDAVASTADTLRCLLDHDNETVQHNAVEALAALVRTRPDTVAPAADDLRELLIHEEVAIQHNAAGVLGHLAEDYPDVVVPAAEDLHDLRDHDDEAVQRIATGALARLVQERPDAVTDQ